MTRLFLRKVSSSAALALALTLATRLASAQEAEAPAHDAEARALHEAGTAAFEDGRFEDALARWESAYSLRSLPELLYNIGSAHDRLGHYDEALEAYNGYLDAVTEPANENFVRRRIEILEGLRADPVEVEEPADSGSRLAPILLTALGGAVFVSGVAVGLRANGIHADITENCNADLVCPPSQEGPLDRLGRLVITADVLMIAGGVATLGGIVWLLVGGRGGEDGDENALRLDVGLGSASLRGSF